MEIVEKRSIWHRSSSLELLIAISSKSTRASEPIRQRSAVAGCKWLKLAFGAVHRASSYLWGFAQKVPRPVRSPDNNIYTIDYAC